MFRERYGMFLVILFLVVTSLCLGVINTILGGIYRRRKENAVLRVIGVYPKEIVRKIHLQVFLYLLAGAFSGIVNGMILTIVLILIDGIHFRVDYLAPLGVFAVLSILLITIVNMIISKLMKEDMLVQISD